MEGMLALELLPIWIVITAKTAIFILLELRHRGPA